MPVLPVTIWGSQRVWTKGQPKRMGRHHVPLLITVGAPIVVAPDENADAATARIHAAMDAQLRADQERYPSWPEAEKHLLPARLGGTAPTPRGGRRDGQGRTGGAAPSLPGLQPPSDRDPAPRGSDGVAQVGERLAQQHSMSVVHLLDDAGGQRLLGGQPRQVERVLLGQAVTRDRHHEGE